MKSRRTQWRDGHGSVAFHTLSQSGQLHRMNWMVCGRCRRYGRCRRHGQLGIVCHGEACRQRPTVDAPGRGARSRSPRPAGRGIQAQAARTPENLKKQGVLFSIETIVWGGAHRPVSSSRAGQSGGNFPVTARAGRSFPRARARSPPARRGPDSNSIKTCLIRIIFFSLRP